MQGTPSAPGPARCLPSPEAPTFSAFRHNFRHDNANRSGGFLSRRPRTTDTTPALVVHNTALLALSRDGRLAPKIFGPGAFVAHPPLATTESGSAQRAYRSTRPCALGEGGRGRACR